MPVTVQLVETTTTLGLEVVGVTVIASATPGPAGAPGSTTFAGLTDVTFTGLATGDRVEYDGAEWVNTASAAVGLHATSHEDGGTDEISLTGLSGTPAALQAHLDDTADAHDASAISIADAGNDFTATDVEGALAELQSDHEADSTALSDHIADATAAHAATAISFTPDGSIAATTVQAAIVEVRDEAGGGGAPTDADYLVGTASGGLSAEIVVGTSPGGELGGTWASPTVDASHSGSTHAAVQAAAEATAAAALSAHLTDTADAHDASAISVDSTNLSGTSITVQGSLEELDNLLDDHSARHENGGADEISLAGLDGTPTALQTHLDDASDAHDASAISVLDSGTNYTATDVEGVLAEIAPQLGGGVVEFDYVTFTSDVNVSATAEASANTIVTANAVVFDGSTEVWIEFSAQQARTAPGADGQQIVLDIFDGGTAIGRIAQVRAGTVAAAESVGAPVFARFRVTPSAASHTYSVRGWVTAAGTAVVQAGSGGATASVPGYIRIVEA